MICASCGSENRHGAKFCVECGNALTQRCGACGTPFDSGRFCAECGEPLPGAQAAAPVAVVDRPPPEAERRLVSVLFVDLVGFTTLSENRDPEETRELLSRYFDEARRVVSRFGGTVEKFIGDAVMAVWGAPIANEDDPERAVRAALDLVSSIAALGEDLGVPALRARAGVLTGEAAVTIGAEGEGMVAGDLVNTAARVQTAAEAGSVLVGEATRRASEAAIVYEDAGLHELKGKAEPIALWRALRIVGGLLGEGRASALEPPFVGRTGELRVVKDLFHATVDEGRARVVSVVGVAGIGKSRLAWEFEKYLDGLVGEVWWHRGRCLSYGEGVAYWALAEMVRMRADILEDEPLEAAQAKLRACIQLHIRDDDERAWIEPRLAHLLGLTERIAPDQEDLFSAWRLFFERMAEEGPAILLFEDLHWADAALLDFIEYLLEWSRTFPLFILTLTRPDLLERRPTWGAGKPNFHSLVLEPLSDEARDELLRGLVPGLPEEVSAEIRDRAEVVPLYAVETVRMLLDRGLLTREDGEYRLTGSLETLEVPETLQALIAARLDGLHAAERRLLEDASVLGRMFTTQSLAAVSGVAESEIESLLSSLRRKEILSVDTDPRSPERGQHGFLHALVQKVAYDRLARKDRKARHLRVAEHLATGDDEDEIVEILASHYVDAYEAVPEAEDAPAIKAQACKHLRRAGERAASLAATDEAQRYFEQAAEIADQGTARAELLELAGEAARAGGRLDTAEAHLERSFALFEDAGAAHAAARVSARLGEVIWLRGSLEDARERMERSFQVLYEDEPDEDVAVIASQLGRAAYFSGHFDLAAERIELALDIAASVGLDEVISQALNTKSLIVRRRQRESLVLLEGALKIALEGDFTSAALRAYYNLAECLSELDRHEEALKTARAGVALARRRGDRTWEWGLIAQMSHPLYFRAAWDEVTALAAEVPEEVRGVASSWHEFLIPLARIYAARGEVEDARGLLSLLASLGDSADLDERTIYAVGLAVVRRAEGRFSDALSAAQQAIDTASHHLLGHRDSIEAMIEAAESAFALGEPERVQSLLDWCTALPEGERIEYLQGHEARFKARLAAAGSDVAQVGPLFEASSRLFRGLGMPFPLAVSLLEHAEWLASDGGADEAEPLRAEARVIFERLKATPWVERATRADGLRAEVVTG
jgi:class 3 adenylate cyclase/tetratricopeptide (TPR) repeat protein